ncbi:HepT-like ribonuclease domain-containing protein [Xylanimonas protaetiae]|uniref:DUF86 domain-containing protein n=1 Tax=Xylanimonas protaetiae TaxID=2509457 RepID=A0A4P6F1H1_9MICO|nr:DUF86 domain-containing protein [Xylanimonas protaetiae]
MSCPLGRSAQRLPQRLKRCRCEQRARPPGRADRTRAHRSAAIPCRTRELLFGGAWPAIWATRNHIAHTYVSVDPAIIAATLGADLDAFEEALRSVR